MLNTPPGRDWLRPIESKAPPGRHFHSQHLLYAGRSGLSFLQGLMTVAIKAPANKLVESVSSRHSVSVQGPVHSGEVWQQKKQHPTIIHVWWKIKHVIKPQSKQKTTPHNHTCAMKIKQAQISIYQISNIKSQISNLSITSDRSITCFECQCIWKDRRWWIPNPSL